MFLPRARNEIPFAVTDRKEITQDTRYPRYAPSGLRRTSIGSFNCLGEENTGKDTHLKNYIEGKPFGNTS
jgi:hypothetical protein